MAHVLVFVCGGSVCNSKNGKIIYRKLKTLLGMSDSNWVQVSSFCLDALKTPPRALSSFLMNDTFPIADVGEPMA